jgi:restriction endonuclease S subunit
MKRSRLLALVGLKATISQQAVRREAQKLSVELARLNALLKQINIPLPPLPIQHKIVTKIDIIFAEIEKAFMNPGAGGIPINFVNLLNYFDIAFRPISYQDGNFSAKTNSFNGVYEKSDKQFFMVMSRIITNPTKKQKFIDEVISGNLKTYKTPVSLLNKFEKIVNQLENTYKKELNAEEKLFKDLRKNKEFKNLVEESIYEPRKPRKFEYNTAVEFTQEEKDKIINLYK